MRIKCRTKGGAIMRVPARLALSLKDVEILDQKALDEYVRAHNIELGWKLKMSPEEYLDRYPEGKHAKDAREALGD